jgi:hypothetical protein
MPDLVPWLLGRDPLRLRSRLRASSPERSDHGGFIELQFDDLEYQMTCIEEGWHMWDEIRIFGDDGLIELRRPLTLPIGWTFDCWTERGQAHESHDADAAPGGATRNLRRRAARRRSGRVQLRAGGVQRQNRREGVRIGGARGSLARPALKPDRRLQ